MYTDKYKKGEVNQHQTEMDTYAPNDALLKRKPIFIHSIWSSIKLVWAACVPSYLMQNVVENFQTLSEFSCENSEI